ncbi:MAG: peroxide stress protein YaaA, partial [Clostridia bacterium]|nr:peroxide stress protein YaaA [Clostridia bacterium]
MKIIISPAKKMNIDCDSLPVLTQPVFMNRAEKLREQLRGMGYEELKKLWKCNDS